jgi:hypothetical protein
MSLKKQREKRIDLKESHDQKLDQELDYFGVKLIKAIGIVGVIIGVVIIVLFWIWIFKKLYG